MSSTITLPRKLVIFVGASAMFAMAGSLWNVMMSQQDAELANEANVKLRSDHALIVADRDATITRLSSALSQRDDEIEQLITVVEHAVNAKGIDKVTMADDFMEYDPDSGSLKIGVYRCPLGQDDDLSRLTVVVSSFDEGERFVNLYSPWDPAAKDSTEMYSGEQ